MAKDRPGSDLFFLQTRVASISPGGWNHGQVKRILLACLPILWCGSGLMEGIDGDPMRNRKIWGRTQRWWFFVGAALLVHGVLVVAITYREVLERPEPVLSGKFVKRRPLQQAVSGAPGRTAGVPACPQAFGDRLASLCALGGSVHPCPGSSPTAPGTAAGHPADRSVPGRNRRPGYRGAALPSVGRCQRHRRRAPGVGAGPGPFSDRQRPPRRGPGSCWTGWRWCGRVWQQQVLLLRGIVRMATNEWGSGEGGSSSAWRPTASPAPILIGASSCLAWRR